MFGFWSAYPVAFLAAFGGLAIGTIARQAESGGGGGSGGQIPCRYEVTVIQAPPCPFFGPPPTIATGLNEQGHVTGFAYDCFTSGIYRPFIWTPEGGFQYIPLPPGILWATPADINDHGVIVGQYERVGVGRRGFVYDRGVWTELPPPFPQGTSGASAINDAGVVCGTRSVGPAFTPYNAFVWSRDMGFTDLGVMMGPNSWAGDVSELGRVVGGTGGLITNQSGYMWQHGRTTLLPLPEPGTFTQANAVSKTGFITGRVIHQPAIPPNIISQPVNWAEQVQPALVCLLPGSFAGSGLAINDAGITVGGCTMSGSSAIRGFASMHGAVIDLNDLVDSSSGVLVEGANGINNAGLITAGGIVAGSVVGLLLTPVLASPADLTCDGQVNGLDLGVLLTSWSIPPGTPGCGGPADALCPADLNGDGIVNGLDLGILLFNWTIK
jgi:uncharacterized membrane protein